VGVPAQRGRQRVIRGLALPLGRLMGWRRGSSEFVGWHFARQIDACTYFATRPLILRLVEPGAHPGRAAPKERTPLCL